MKLEHLGRYCSIGKTLRFRNEESELYRIILLYFIYTITPPKYGSKCFPTHECSSLVQRNEAVSSSLAPFSLSHAGQVVPSCEEDIELKDLVEKAKLHCNPRHVPESVRPPKKISGSTECVFFLWADWMGIEA